jgi:xylulokinase
VNRPDDMSQSDFVLGLDIGTSSAKVCALTSAGRFIGLEGESYPTQVPAPAWAEQDSELWLPALGRACKRLLRRLDLTPKNVRGLAISSAAHIAVLLDRKNHPIRPALLWNDQRSQSEAAALAEAAGTEIFATTNNWPTATWSLPHLLWVAKHEPGAWSRVRHILLSKDYVGFQLTGHMVTDAATAASALLFDAASGAWAEHLCALGGISISMLPEVRPVTSEIGRLLPEAASTLGLPVGTRIFNGSLDSTAETFAAGVRVEGDCVVRLGTAGGIHCIAYPPFAHPKLISYPYSISPYWLTQAGTNTCGSAIQWAQGLFPAATGGKLDFAAWTATAEQSPLGSGGLFFHPYLAGERCPYWDGDLRASFIGLGLHHRTSDMARAVYEGTAFALRDAFTVLEERGIALRRVRLIGGGAKSTLWSHIITAVLDCTTWPTPQADSSAGAALFTLSGLGDLSTLAKIPSNILFDGEETLLTPDAGWRDAYGNAFGKYKRIQHHLSEIYHERSETSV